MKRIIIFLIIALTSMAAATQIYAAGEKNAPAITIDKKSYDFGTIKEADGKVTHEFTFTNTGTAPLVIIKAAAGCGCVKVKYPDAPIAPGGKGVITATYNPRGQSGNYTKKISVQTNAPKDKKLSLLLTVCVIPK